MRKLLYAALSVGLSGLVASGVADAYSVTMSTGNTPNGATFNAAPDGSFATATGGNFVTATFDYSGPLTFAVNAGANSTASGDKNSNFFGLTNARTITNYQGTPNTLGRPADTDFSTLASFLASSGSASGYQYGSLLIFDLGILSSGTDLTIEHDDGVSVYQGGTRIGTTTAGPTADKVESVLISNTADTLLYYARENGSPSILNVQGIPEPSSVALVASAFLGFVFTRRRKS